MIFERIHKPDMNIFNRPKDLKKWITKSTKGAFFFNKVLNGIVSNSFAIDVNVETSFYITIEAYKTNLHQSKIAKVLISKY